MYGKQISCNRNMYPKPEHKEAAGHWRAGSHGCRRSSDSINDKAKALKKTKAKEEEKREKVCARTKDLFMRTLSGSFTAACASAMFVKTLAVGRYPISIAICNTFRMSPVEVNWLVAFSPVMIELTMVGFRRCTSLRFSKIVTASCRLPLTQS